MKKVLGGFIFIFALLALALLLALRGGFLDTFFGSRPVVDVIPSAAPAAATDALTPPVHMTPDPTPSAEPTAESTPEPTPEAEPESFVLSFIGDLTLTGSPGVPVDFEGTMNGDFGYPFSNVKQYFLDDEYTFGNLECTFSDQWLSSIEYFNFRAPTTSANRQARHLGDAGELRRRLRQERRGADRHHAERAEDRRLLPLQQRLRRLPSRRGKGSRRDP